MVAAAGRHIIVAGRFASAPAGPTVVFAVGAPGRRGARIGLTFTTVARSDEGAGLRWSPEVDDRCVQWEERGIVLRGHFRRLAVPMAIPLRPLVGSAGVDLIPRSVSGRCRPGRVVVTVAPHDELAWLAGRHRGVLVSGPSVVAGAVRAARALPFLRARGRAAEPTSFS